MAIRIKGIPVTLYERTQTGTDAFGAPVFSENPVIVENILVSPSSAEEIVKDLQFSGKKTVCVLSIPKGDKHRWEDCRVEFFGKTWHCAGPVTQLMEHLVPLDWDKSIRAVRYE